MTKKETRDHCYHLCEWLCIWLPGCLHKNKVVHERGKRLQTQMDCYIYFSGKRKWWQKWWQMGWVIILPWLVYELFTNQPWLRLQLRLEAVLLLVALTSQICHPMAKVSRFASVAKPFLLACSMLCFNLSVLCFLLCGWDCFHMLTSCHHILVCNNGSCGSLVIVHPRQSGFL
jgi:hypothetical protein